MSSGKVRRLPVVGDDALLEGIVSMDDVVLRALHGDGKTGSGVSYADVVNTLQAIYARDGQFHGRSAAA
jgi:CBS domain-containing protein